MNALCYTLQDDILSHYEECLVVLEEEIMMDQDITLTYIHSRLQDCDYSLLFPAISQLIEEVQTRKVVFTDMFLFFAKSFMLECWHFFIKMTRIFLAIF